VTNKVSFPMGRNDSWPQFSKVRLDRFLRGVFIRGCSGREGVCVCVWGVSIEKVCLRASIGWGIFRGFSTGASVRTG